ncbi:Pentatricopeptide repeat-containing protein [Diplonema papillatum]|nr:Pentatricopeptide repeat-containing protein [Diplonema papillatum]
MRLRAALLRQIRCRFDLAGEGRHVEHGYTGTDGGVRWPVLPPAEALQRWGDADASQYLLRGYGGLVRKAFDSPGKPVNVTQRTPLLRRLTRDLALLDAHDVPVGPITYATYAKLMASAGVHGRLVSSIPAKLRSLGYTPTTRLYNVVLQAFAVYGKLDEMNELLKMMRQDSAQADVFTYNSVMTCFIKRHDWNKVLWLFQRMQAEGIEPNEITYDKVIASCPGRAAGKIVMDAMEARGVNVKTTHYVSLLSACRRESALEMMVPSAEAVLQEVADRSLGPTALHYDTLLLVYKESGDFKGLEQVLWDRVNGEVAPTGITYAVYLAACAAKAAEPGDVYVESAEKCFNHAVTHGWHGQLKLYVEMMRVYVMAVDVGRAELLLSRLRGSLAHVRNAASLLVLVFRLYVAAAMPDKAADVRSMLVTRWGRLGYSPQEISLRLALSPMQNGRDITGTQQPVALQKRKV